MVSPLKKLLGSPLEVYYVLLVGLVAELCAACLYWFEVVFLEFFLLDVFWVVPGFALLAPG